MTRWGPGSKLALQSQGQKGQEQEQKSLSLHANSAQQDQGCAKSSNCHEARLVCVAKPSGVSACKQETGCSTIRSKESVSRSSTEHGYS